MIFSFNVTLDYLRKFCIVSYLKTKTKDFLIIKIAAEVIIVRSKSKIASYGSFSQWEKDIFFIDRNMVNTNSGWPQRISSPTKYRDKRMKYKKFPTHQDFPKTKAINDQ